jgi:hypothetical protein
MVLTPRDHDILCHVYRFRRMTREQVERLLFRPDHGQDHPTKTNIARKRLRLLFHHGYLERIPMPAANAKWALRPVYRLSRKGAELIANELGTTPGKLRYWGKGDDDDHRATEVSQLFLNHALDINDVRIAVQHGAAGLGCTVEEWLDDTDLKRPERKESVTITTEHGGHVKVPVIPDAYFVVRLGDQRARFFLELDRATMSNSRWKRRILAYRKFVESGKYFERYKATSLRILTVTTTPKRMASLQLTTANAGGGDLFWFTTLPDATSGNFLLSRIWRLANEAAGGLLKSLIA